MNLNLRYIWGVGLVLFALFTSCTDEPKPSATPAPSENPQAYKQVSPAFNADTAYQYVQKQVDFGPRVCETPAHQKCGDWLVSEYKKYAQKVTEQKGSMKKWDKKDVAVRNIMASFNPEAKKRIMISAHWDCRPWADHDASEANHNTPVLGADDAASGVAVMLEIARVLHSNMPSVGVDLVCFDTEDLGKQEAEDSYCLGSQYWARQAKAAGYKAAYAINLDMVAGRGARFIWEEVSVTFAENVLRKVWDTGVKLGYSDYFYYYQKGGIIDDHSYVNQIAGIPAIDIIHYNEQTNFPAWWHTVYDDMRNIDRNTLKAVGQTLLEVIYTE